MGVDAVGNSWHLAEMKGKGWVGFERLARCFEGRIVGNPFIALSV